MRPCALLLSCSLFTGSVLDPDSWWFLFKWFPWIRICIENTDFGIWIQNSQNDVQEGKKSESSIWKEHLPFCWRDDGFHFIIDVLNQDLYNNLWLKSVRSLSNIFFLSLFSYKKKPGSGSGSWSVLTYNTRSGSVLYRSKTLVKGKLLVKRLI